MENVGREELPEDEANKIFNEILKEDALEDEDDEVSELCPAACAMEEPIVEKRLCECTRMAENTSRFSLRVMEAMRLLQHEGNGLQLTSTVEDIVGYIEANYHDGGDLYAQVRTALKQVCSQGFVMELLRNQYHLVGPDAITMNRIEFSDDRVVSLSTSSTRTSPRKRDRHEDDNCDCEETVSKKRRNPVDPKTKKDLQDHEEDVTSEEDPEGPYSLTDEPDTAPRIRRNVREETLKETYLGTGGGEKKTGDTEAKTAKNGTQNDEDSVTDDTVSNISENVYEGNKSLSQAKETDQREKEVKRWIKRCQEECRRRGVRRATNN